MSVEVAIVHEDTFIKVLLWDDAVGVVEHLASGAIVSQGFGHCVREATAGVYIAEEDGSQCIAAFFARKVGKEDAVDV